MRRALWVTSRLLAGLCVSVIHAGCFGSCPDAAPIEAGRYIALEIGPETDYDAVLSADLKTAVESYTRNGHRYVVTYKVASAP